MGCRVKLALLIGVVLLMLSSVARAATCAGSVCNLKVYGTVTATSCDVDNASAHQTVNLGDVNLNAFKKVGSVSRAEAFHIQLKDCSASITGGTITFQGTPDSDNNDLLQLTPGSGVATGVGVEILDGNSGKPVALGAVTATHPLSSGDNDLLYYLRYKSTQTPVTPGTANAVMYFDLNYQ
jgi:P pilus assembly protein, pilin FimA